MTLGAYLEMIVVDQERRYPQSTDGKTRSKAYVTEVVIHVPMHAEIRNDVHLGVIQFRDLGQGNAGAVGLYPQGQNLVDILQEHFDRYLLVCVVAADVDAYQRDRTGPPGAPLKFW